MVNTKYFTIFLSKSAFDPWAKRRRCIIFLNDHFIIYLIICNLIFNYEFLWKIRKLKKMLKIARSKKLLGYVKTDSISVKNQSQVFPSHIMGFQNKKWKREKKTSYTFCITRTLLKQKIRFIFYLNELMKLTCNSFFHIF